MAKKKRGETHGGGHGWFVTFADLMGLMMSFFVMLVAFSTMDNNKLKIVAGSMRDAFGVQTNARYSGIIESDGLPTRPKLKNVDHIAPEESSDTPTPDEQDKHRTSGAKLQDRPRIRAGLGLAAAGAAGHAGTDRDVQAHHVRGDQAGPQPRNRRPGRPLDVRRRLQGALRAHPPADPEARGPAQGDAVARLHHRPHAAGFVPARSDYGAFDLSADRANAVRQILEREGLPASHIFAVSGKADSQPLFPDDPSLAANRRVTITLMREDPPLPPDLKP